MMILYHIYDGFDDVSTYFETKTEALKAARELVEFDDEEIEVEKLRIAKMPARKFAIALLHRIGFVDEKTVIARIKGRKKRED
jgi:hypothetical protein